MFGDLVLTNGVYTGKSRTETQARIDRARNRFLADMPLSDEDMALLSPNLNAPGLEPDEADALNRKWERRQEDREHLGVGWRGHRLVDL